MTTMSTVEIGKIVDGIVTGITNFGAFVQLSDGKTGLCHISEIADSYVKSVADHLTEAQPVKVKIISVDEKGKVSLSIRQAVEKSEVPVEKKPVHSENAAASSSAYVPRAQSKPYVKSEGGYNKPAGGFNKSEGSFNKGGGGFNKSSGGFNKSDGGFNKNAGGFNKSAGRSDRRPDSLEDMISGFLKDSDDKLKSIKKPSKSNRKGNGYNNKD